MSRSFSKPLDRRSFLRASAAAVVAGALMNVGWTPKTARAAHGGDLTDVDILNYALTLEHLESRAYKDVNSIGLLSGRAREYFIDFGDQEAAHVVALTGVINKLGGTPVRAQESYNWPTFQNEQEVLDYFHMLEELGAAAYLGQATAISDPDLLTAAVSIHNVEGQHAAILADLVGKEPSPAFAQGKDMATVVAAITPILDMKTPTAMPSTGLGGVRGAGRLSHKGLPQLR
ncbi:MAG: ferritin-like domain-containing protein [Caldilineae bacterium]|nr:MAG: ferritin-like domain-containing protein [Caldilineae bacterium]